jgi:hypothetical protein
MKANPILCPPLVHDTVTTTRSLTRYEMQRNRLLQIANYVWAEWPVGVSATVRTGSRDRDFSQGSRAGILFKRLSGVSFEYSHCHQGWSTTADEQNADPFYRPIETLIRLLAHRNPHMMLRLLKLVRKNYLTAWSKASATRIPKPLPEFVIEPGPWD